MLLNSLSPFLQELTAVVPRMAKAGAHATTALAPRLGTRYNRSAWRIFLSTLVGTMRVQLRCSWPYERLQRLQHAARRLLWRQQHDAMQSW